MWRELVAFLDPSEACLDVINVVAQMLPTMVHNYIQYLVNVVAIQIMSTGWRNGLS